MSIWQIGRLAEWQIDVVADYVPPPPAPCTETGQARREGHRSAGDSLIEEIHGAPAGSFVARLAVAIAGLKSEKEMAHFWLEVVKEVRPSPSPSPSHSSP